MIKIVFVCHGNICRSPMAEFYMKKLVKEKGKEQEFRIVSRAATSEEIINGKGHPIYPPALKTLHDYGVDDPAISRKRAQLITLDDYKNNDLIIGMDQENLYDLDQLFHTRDKISLLLDYTDHPRDVSDPWYTRDFDACMKDIMTGCLALYDHLSRT